ncbi:MAG TPA: hypothetical protein DCW29_09905 [Janthinobacterium sp.]|nr:hypothetical protein [Janthinobacterium sp.]
MRTAHIKALLLGAAFACLHANGCAASDAQPQADTAATIPSVEVSANRDNRDKKSYRRMPAGMDPFESEHQLAPRASLRFKVVPRRAGVTLDGLALHIYSKHGNIAVPLASDASFAVPRDAAAAHDDAALAFNRADNSLAWHADMRSPGLPPNARRLGELLLECKVDMVADLVAYIHTPINIMVGKLPDPCRTLPINMFYFADRPLFSVTLVYGARRGVLPADLLHGPALTSLAALQDWTFQRDRVYQIQFKSLYEKGWPDDTLLEFDYIDDDVAAAKPARQGTI